MNKTKKSRLLSFLLAIVMILGSASPAFAAGLEAPNGTLQKAESELVSDNGKLRARLVVPRKTQVQTRSMRVFTTQANKPEDFNKTTVEVNIVKHGINGKEFDFEGLFGANPETKIILNNFADDTSQEKTVTASTTSVTFDNKVLMTDVTNGDIYIEFDGENIAGKLTYDEASADYSGASDITKFTLELYQYVNPQVKVTTVNKDGTAVNNPPTTTGGKIKVTAGTEEKEIDIPAGTDAVETFKDREVNTTNVTKFQSTPTVEVTGLENGVLVDKDANKVYKQTEIKVDPKGIDPTEIKFTEKPLTTTDDMSGDPDYVKVEFAAGDHGKFADGATTEYYVFKGVDMGKTLSNPSITADDNYAFTTWKEALKTKYDAGETHTAQYKYIGDDVVPQKPGEDKPNVPTNFVLVEFKAGTNGTIADTETTKYWVNPTAGKKVSDLDKPTVTANKDWKHTGWDKADTEEIKAAMEITAQYKQKVVTENPNDTENYAHVTFTTDKGSIKGTKEYWVLKNEKVTFAVPEVDLTGVTGYTFKEWNPAVAESYTADTAHKATFNYTGKDIVPQKPGEDKPNVPTNFVLVEFKAGTNGTIADTETTKYWVNPTAGKKVSDLDKPTVTANKDWKHTGWDKADTEEIKAAMEITAQYKSLLFNKDKIIKIEFTKDPNKMTYTVGDKPVHDGLEITLTDENGNTQVVTKDKLGEYGITVTPAENTNLAKGDNGKHFVAKVNDKDGKEIKADSPGTITVNDKPSQDKSAKPVINSPKAGSKTITGKGVKGAKVNVTMVDKNDQGKVIAQNVEVQQDGTWTANVPNGVTLEVGDTILAVQIEDGKEVSDQANAPVVQDQSKKPEVNQPTEGDKKITGKGESGSDIVVELPDGTKVPGKVDNHGNWEVEVPADKKLEKDDKIKVTQKEEGKDPSEPAEATVKGKEESSKPKVDQPTEGDDKITGKGEPGAKIVVKDKDDNVIGETEVNDKGEWEVPVPGDKPLKKDDKITVEQTEKGKKPNTAETTVLGKGEEPKPEPQPEPMPTPEYNPWWPIYFGSTKTEVKPEPKHLERHEAYIAGYPDGTVRPDGKITRAEVTAILARLTENSAPANYSPKFSDVLAYDWFCDSVMKLSNKDIIKGYPDGTFKPNKSITRAEFAVIASKYIKNPKAADETFSDVPMNHWAKDAIAMVKAEGWISGYTDGTFKPDAPITRAEAVSIVNRMFNRAADGEFVRDHNYEISNFKDLLESHWAYYDMIEATHTHDFESLNGGIERWEKIVK